jgi:hypothetical protein
MIAIHKYPRTQHIEGSRLQPGDEDLESVPFARIQGRFIVAEEKLDGANAGLRFDETGRLLLQSRGHFLTGGYREKHFDLFKQWASSHARALHDRLGHRYAVFGEWLYAKHTIFYDHLPHYFLEFDVLDLQEEEFLSTDERRLLLAGLPLVCVPVLHRGLATTKDDLVALIGPSLYKGPDWRERLSEAAAAAARGYRDQGVAETDPSDLMEGLYIKVEEAGRVVERYKYVRASFLTAVKDSGTHWLRRPIIPNALAEGVDLFGGGT